jgi:hypothetical protein
VTTIDPKDPRLQGRPLWGLLILALPIVGVAFTFVAYAIMVGMGVRGRAPTGEQVSLAFAGCPEAAAVVGDRMRDMGLEGRPIEVPGGFGFEVVLPSDPDVASRIPATLSAPGRLEILGEGTVLATNADVVDASVRMDLMMVPSTLLQVGPEAAERIVGNVRAHPEGRLEFVIDGAAIGTQSNRNPVGRGEVEIAPPGLDGEARFHAVAEWSIIVDHPLPCEITASAPADP